MRLLHHYRGLSVVLGILALASVCRAADDTATRCRSDLARRLKVKLDQVRVDQQYPGTFLDGSLGFPRPGEVYTKAITQGYHLVLAARGRAYLYAANDQVCRYGGPAEARRFSALFLAPADNDPNGNGDLVQVALAGDNPRVLLSGVDNFRPQPDGSVIAMRRTSRSGYDLLYLAPGKVGQPVRLAAGLHFTDAAVSNDGKQWAAITRPRLGSAGWFLLRGTVPGAPEGEPLALPAGVPQRVYLHQGQPLVTVLNGERQECYQLADDGFRPAQFTPPPTEELLQSRSTSLAVQTTTTDGKDVTSVATSWWHGQKDPIATIADFAVSEYAVVPGASLLLLSGRSGEQHRAYTVDTATGEVLVTVEATHGPVRLLLAPGAAPVGLAGPG